MNTMEAAISRKIEEKAADIRDFIRMGWTREDAIAQAKKSSTLGTKSWDRVLGLLGD